MKTTTKTLFISMFFVAAVPSMLFSAEKNPPVSDPIEVEAFRRLLVLNATTDPDVRNKIFLTNAIRRNNLVKVQQLIQDNGIEVNRQAQHGHTPLKWATLKRDPSMIKLLLQLNADINSQSFDGYTALGLSVFQRDVKTTKLLLQFNADPHSIGKNCEGGRCRTPLQIAKTKDYTEIVALLRESKPDEAE